MYMMEFYLVMKKSKHISAGEEMDLVVVVLRETSKTQKTSITFSLAYGP